MEWGGILPLNMNFLQDFGTNCGLPLQEDYTQEWCENISSLVQTFQHWILSFRKKIFYWKEENGFFAFINLLENFPILKVICFVGHLHNFFQGLLVHSLFIF